MAEAEYIHFAEFVPSNSLPAPQLKTQALNSSAFFSRQICISGTSCWQYRMSETLNLERLYDEHAQSLFAFLVNLLRNDPDARDVLQENFIRLARHPELLASARDARAFLLRMAHNLAIDLIRRRDSRDRNFEAFALESAEVFARAENPDEQTCRENLATALAVLPPEQRAVVHLKLWEGLTFEDIAAILDTTPNTAASRYRYGIDKLRDRLRPIYEEIQ
jgi:RNA polymerase sigma-70 factor (ECF subfamily)